MSTQEIEFTPAGTCSRLIRVVIQDGVVRKVTFVRGCTGSLEAISRLVEGKPVAQVIELLQGIQCQNGTSCPDQLAKALRQSQ